MRSSFKVAGIAALALLFISSAPLGFAKKPVAQTYVLTISVNGSWHQDPSFNCPGQCTANDRFYAHGTLTYHNATSSTSMSITLNGTAHSFWGGVNANNPCTTITAQMQINTKAHDKIHLSVTGTDCETFIGSRYTGRNVYTEVYNITSGEGTFSEATGSGSVGGYGYPGVHMWLANANGTITFVPKPHGDN